MATAREIDPFLKADFPTRAPKRHGQTLLRRVPGFPPYDTGARPHMSYRLTRSTKKANHRTRSMQLPRSYAPFIFGATSGQEGKPPRKKRTTAPRLCAPSASLQPAVQHGGSGPHVIQPARRLPGAEKSHRRSRQCHVFSGSSRKTEKISFQNQCNDSRQPAHGPAVALSMKITGQSTVGIGVAVGMTIGGAGSNCANRRTGAASQSLIKLCPHLHARILP
jgi:hypothetical protein